LTEKKTGSCGEQALLNNNLLLFQSPFLHNFVLTRLSKEVGVFELTEDDCSVLEEYLKEYCQDFGLKLKDVMKEKFVKILPKSKRPYGNMYYAMPR